MKTLKKTFKKYEHLDGLLSDPKWIEGAAFPYHILGDVWQAVKKHLENDILYVVLMNRWGDRESHSYVLRRAFYSEENAIQAGVEEKKHRGGKYEPEIVRVKVDE